MKSISWDLETYSSVDLTKCGVYRYCESEDFEILLAAYSIDGGAVQVTDLACGLNNLQKIRDGEPLGGKSRPEDDFAEEDEDFLS